MLNSKKSWVIRVVEWIVAPVIAGIILILISQFFFRLDSETNGEDESLQEISGHDRVNPEPRRYELQFRQLTILNDSDPRGAGEIWVMISVNGEEVRFPSQEGEVLDLSNGEGTVMKDVAFPLTLTPEDTVLLEIEAKDFDDNRSKTELLGEIRHTLSGNQMPNSQIDANWEILYSTQDEGHFSVEYRVVPLGS